LSIEPGNEELQEYAANTAELRNKNTPTVILASEIICNPNFNMHQFVHLLVLLLPSSALLFAVNIFCYSIKFLNNQ
jgi:hypothetical protein